MFFHTVSGDPFCIGVLDGRSWLNTFRRFSTSLESKYIVLKTDNLLTSYHEVKMQGTLVELKAHIRNYREIDDELRDLNKQVYEKRDARKIVELDIAEILKRPEFSEFKKVKVEEDGSTISIKRPSEWTKPWSLSQKDLKELTNQYFASATQINADGLFKWIVENRKREMVSEEFSFTRTVPGDNDE